jgi:hypothetical protein
VSEGGTIGADQALLEAARTGDLNAVFAALARRARIGARYDQGRTVLTLAAAGAFDPRVVSVLLQAGADVDAADEVVHALRDRGS